MKQLTDIKKVDTLRIIFWCSFFAFGLFHEYMACIFCGVYGISLCFTWKKNKHLKFYWNIETVTVSIIVFMYFVASLYGVDSGMGIIGFIKMLSIFFFLCCIMQITDCEKKQLLDSIPVIGCVMTVAGMLAYVLQPLQEYFFVAQRLGGAFQYPNVYALFCLLGLNRLFGYMEQRKIDAFRIVQAFLLIVGIFLSGSRTVFFLFLLVCVIWGIREKRYRMPLLFTIVGFLGVGLVYTYLTGDYQNIGRFLTASASSSTLLGRILYIKDGIRLILEHPMGLGYLGYYFMEPGIQTGVYSIRFIHNDFLQMALDIGIIPCVLFVAVWIKSICNKQNSFENRISLLLMGLHCIVDFDLEFTAMWFVLILFFKWDYGKEKTTDTMKFSNVWKGMAGLLSMTGIYAGVTMLPVQFGNMNLTVQLLPIYTEGRIAVLKEETDMEMAVDCARDILSQNEFIPSAYDVLALAEYQRGNYQAMAEYKEKSLKLQRYNMDAYERYIMLLSNAIEMTESSGDKQMEINMRRKVISAEKMLQRVEETTDALAYKLRDTPDFSPADEVAEYVRQTKELLNK